MIPWIAQTIKQSLQSYGHRHQISPAVQGIGHSDLLSNIYLPCPPGKVVEVIEVCKYPLFHIAMAVALMVSTKSLHEPYEDILTRLSDSEFIIESKIPPDSIRDLTEVPVCRPEDIAPGVFLQLEECQLRLSTSFKPPRYFLQIKRLRLLHLGSPQMQADTLEMCEATSLVAPSGPFNGASNNLQPGAGARHANKLETIENQENIVQDNAGQRSKPSKGLSKDGRGKLLELVPGGSKRKPLSIQQNATINATTMMILKERHSSGQRSIQPVEEPLTSARCSPMPQQQENLYLTQVAPITSATPEAPVRGQQPTPPPQIASLERKLSSSSEMATPSSTSRKIKSGALVRDQLPDARSPKEISSRIKWSKLRDSLESERYLSRSSMRIPISQEDLLGKDTSYWPPLAGGPKPEINIPLKVLTSITAAIDCPDLQERQANGSVKPDSKESPNGEPNTPLNDDGTDVQEIESSQSEVSEVDWPPSSPPPSLRLPPDSSPQREIESSPKISAQNNESEKARDEPIAEDPLRSLPPRHSPVTPTNEGGDKGTLHPESSQHIDEPRDTSSQKLVSSAGPSAISPSPIDNNISEAHKPQSLTQESLPTVQVFRTPITTETNTTPNRRALSSSDIDMETSNGKSCSLANLDDTAPVGANPISNRGTGSPVPHDTQVDFEFESSEDELPAAPLENPSHGDISDVVLPDYRAPASAKISANSSPTSITINMANRLQSSRKGNSAHSGHSPPDSHRSRESDLSSLNYESPQSDTCHGSRHQTTTIPRSNEEELSNGLTAEDCLKSSPDLFPTPYRDFPHRLSENSRRGQGRVDRQSAAPNSDKLPSPYHVLKLTSPKTRKRKRVVSNKNEEDSQSCKSSPHRKIEILDPDVPAYRAAQVKREFFRQQAQKRKLGGSNEQHSRASLGSSHSFVNSKHISQTLRYNRSGAAASRKPTSSSKETAKREHSAFSSSQDSDRSRSSSPSFIENEPYPMHSTQNTNFIDRRLGQVKASTSRTSTVENSHGLQARDTSPVSFHRRQSRAFTLGSYTNSTASKQNGELRPPEVAFQEMYRRFRSTYAEYTADIRPFLKACRSLKRLRTEGKAPHPSLFDDFIARRELDYSRYLREVAAKGDDPMPYTQFFDETEPRYTQRILSVTDFDMLPENDRNLEAYKKGLDDIRSLDRSLSSASASTPPYSIPERASGEASPEIPYSNDKTPMIEDDVLALEDDHAKETLSTKTVNDPQERKWYHDPNTAFKKWSRGISRRDRPLIDENGVPWRSAASERVISIFKRI